MNCKLSMDLVASSFETITKSRLEPDSRSSTGLRFRYSTGNALSGDSLQAFVPSLHQFIDQELGIYSPLAPVRYQ